MRQSDRGFESVTDGVGQQAYALQPAARLEFLPRRKLVNINLWLTND